MQQLFRGVTQFGRVLGLGPRCRRFKSCHLDHVAANPCSLPRFVLQITASLFGLPLLSPQSFALRGPRRPLSLWLKLLPKRQKLRPPACYRYEHHLAQGFKSKYIFGVIIFFAICWHRKNRIIKLFLSFLMRFVVNINPFKNTQKYVKIE